MTTTPRGRLKIYLGYAAGVGKTYQMLTEARELASRGVDVVVGYFEPHGRKDTIALTGGLEIVPRRVLEYRGSRFEEMDVDAILRRAPKIAVIDELPHTNVPGAGHAKRWEDVHTILDAGIDVATTMNVQHLESLNDQIWQSTGVRVRETIPDWVVREADEVVMVDLTPRALLNRLERGVVYAPERAQAALQNFFREPTLAALRELAMRQTAHAVESRHDASDTSGELTRSPDARVERVLLVVGPDPATATLIRRGRRVADYLRAECLAVYVAKSAALDHLTAVERESLHRQLNFARGLQIETHIVNVRKGNGVAEAVVNFARARAVTQIFIARQQESAWDRVRGGGLVERLVNLARDMQVTVVADRTIVPARAVG